MAKLGKVGNMVVKRTRGKMVGALKNGGTEQIGSRGKRVSVDKKKKIISVKNRNRDIVKGKGKTFARRGKSATVLNRVRSQ